MRNDFIHVHHNKSESPETQPSKDIKTDHGPRMNLPHLTSVSFSTVILFG